MAETSQQNILGYAPIGKLLKSFAWPAIISMVANALYNVVDQIFIGNAVGYQGITAATVTFPIVTISIAVSGLIGIGSSAYAAILLGEGRREDAETVLNTQTTAGLFVGIVLMVWDFFIWTRCCAFLVLLMLRLLIAVIWVGSISWAFL